MLLHSVRDSLIILAADNDLLTTHNPVYKTKVYISGVYIFIYSFTFICMFLSMSACVCAHMCMGAC